MYPNFQADPTFCPFLVCSKSKTSIKITTREFYMSEDYRPRRVINNKIFELITFGRKNWSSEDYLHRFQQTWFAEVDIFMRVETLQRFNQCRYIDIVIVIKMTKPPNRGKKKKVCLHGWKITYKERSENGHFFLSGLQNEPRASGSKARLSGL